jgi:hypothetical protein
VISVMEQRSTKKGVAAQSVLRITRLLKRIY